MLPTSQFCYFAELIYFSIAYGKQNYGLNFKSNVQFSNLQLFWPCFLLLASPTFRLFYIVCKCQEVRELPVCRKQRKGIIFKFVLPLKQISGRRRAHSAAHGKLYYCYFWFAYFLLIDPYSSMLNAFRPDS